MRDFRLYIILDRAICEGVKRDILEVAQQTIDAGADVIQLRTKGCSDRRIVELAKTIKELTKKSRALFILNDRVDIARIVDADGVHLGQQDLPVEDARKILGLSKLIGVSAHTFEEAVEAERQGADYLGLGPVFSTALKPDAPALSLENITKIKDRIRIPFVAIGGIDLNNVSQVLACGAQRVAVCRSIITAKDISTATEQFRQRLYKHKPQTLTHKSK